ncbi:hypothetical protein GCM10019059_39900 [Camelimonas fluminis]|uniref:Rad52/Rad22 family DNA repair protein n=1 Tax=Camelimonas fluminis TaxID=1576911 RepID=A0ABV7UJG9_9HYPH|nr:Rad52/Rad22 family DNA repair protein [Camelimonas fluminis]GHE76672.1 hypothetical protein GCM10019059_39900 [Camelimonas fluminis]
MPRKISEIRAKLNTRVPDSAFNQRTGSGGKTYHYIDGDFITFQMNDIFGIENIDKEIKDLKLEGVRKTVFSHTANQTDQNTGTSAEKTIQVPSIEFSYSCIVRLTLRVTDENGATLSFIREGAGAGVGICRNTTADGHHRARQLAIKFAETDATKRAAKQLGSALGLATGEGGKQQYAMISEDDEHPTDHAIPAPDRPAATIMPPHAANHSGNTRVASGVQTAPQASAQQQGTGEQPPPGRPQPSTQAQRPVPADPSAGHAQQAPRQAPASVEPQHRATPPAAGVAPQNRVQAPSRPAEAPRPNTTSAPQRPENVPAAPAVPTDHGTRNPVAQNDQPSVDIRLSSINTDEHTLSALDIPGWTAQFRNLYQIMTKSESSAQLHRICEITGSYLQIMEQATKPADKHHVAAFREHMLDYLIAHNDTMKFNLPVKDLIAPQTFTPPY